MKSLRRAFVAGTFTLAWGVANASPITVNFFPEEYRLLWQWVFAIGRYCRQRLIYFRQFVNSD